MRAARSNDEIRTERVVGMLKPHIVGSTLDVGCYNGGVTRLLSDSIVGIDVVDPPNPRVPVTRYDGIHIPFPDQSFDTVVCSFVLHHCKQPEALLTEMKRVGKRLVVLEDTFDNLLDRQTVLLAHWMFYLTIGMPFERRAFRPCKAWREFFQKGGLEILETARHPSALPYWPFLRHDVYVLRAPSAGEAIRRN